MANNKGKISVTCGGGQLKTPWDEKTERRARIPSELLHSLTRKYNWERYECIYVLNSRTDRIV